MNIGERIKQERKRLGFSQTDFAALGNSSKGAQITWEKGAVYPNALVLAAWANNGLDVIYVLTGHRATERLEELDGQYQAVREVIGKIQSFLRLEKYDSLLYQAVEMARKEVSTKWDADGGTDHTSAAVKALLDKSPALLLDQSAFEDVIERLEFVLEMKKATLSPTNKARAILALHEATKSSGARVDLGMVENVIQKVLA